MRVRGWLAAAAIVVTVVVASPAAAQVDPGAAPVATTAPAPSASQVPLPQPTGQIQGVNATDFTVQTVPLAAWLDSIATAVFGALGGILNTSVAIAQAIFFVLAGIEFAWLCGRWAISSTPLEEMVAAGYLRAVQAGLLYLIIGATFTLPNGAPGWFPMIVGGIVGVAQNAIGMTVVSPHAGDNLLVSAAGWMPGDFFTLFWNIAVLFLKQAFFQKSLAEIFTGAFTGATALWMISCLFALFVSLNILVLGCYVSFRMFLLMFKAYLVAAQCYLQGFLGSRVTSGVGNGMFNAAFNLGVEMASVVIVAGIFRTLLIFTLQQMSLSALAGNTTAGNVQWVWNALAASPIGALTDSGLRIVAMLIVDIIVIMWWYATIKCPEIASEAITGQLRVSPEEVLAQAMFHNAGAKTLRVAGGVAAGAAIANPGLAAAAVAGAGKAFGGGPAMAARFAPAALAIAGGAARGGLLVGPAGAVGGVIGAAVLHAGAAPASAESSSDRGFANREFAPKSGARGARSTADAGAGRTAGNAEPGGEGAPSEANAAAGARSRAGVGAGARGTATVSDGGHDSAAPQDDPTQATGTPRDATSASVGGTDVIYQRANDRATTTGSGGGSADAPGGADGADASRAGGARGATVRDGSGPHAQKGEGTSRGTGGENGGGQQGAAGDELARHRFGAGHGSGGSGAAGGSVDPFLGGGLSGAGMPSYAQMMLVRRLMQFGGQRPQHGTAEVPQAQLSPTSLIP